MSIRLYLHIKSNSLLGGHSCQPLMEKVLEKVSMPSLESGVSSGNVCVSVGTLCSYSKLPRCYRI